MGFPGGTSDNLPANAGNTRDAYLIPGSGEVGNGTPPQDSCL